MKKTTTKKANKVDLSKYVLIDLREIETLDDVLARFAYTKFSKHLNAAERRVITDLIHKMSIETLFDGHDVVIRKNDGFITGDLKGDLKPVKKTFWQRIKSWFKK